MNTDLYFEKSSGIPEIMQHICFDFTTDATTPCSESKAYAVGKGKK